MPHKKPGKIDIEFTEGTDRISFGIFMQKGVLIYGSPFAKNRKGVAFDTPETMATVAESMASFAKQWKEALEKKEGANE